MLLNFNFLDEATIFGAKLKLTTEQLLLIMPLVITIPYFFVNNTLRNITRIVNLLLINSKKVLDINEDSRPFQTPPRRIFY